jgi:hypothetical protein
VRHFGFNGRFRSDDDYLSRVEALRQRVADAAEEMNARGIRPTVARIRAALGGGSPNDLAPALKVWKESFQPTSYSAHGLSPPAQRIPAQIADLAHEMWQRASIAAGVERKGSGAARALAMRSEEAQSLKTQVTSLRDQLQHESIALGELRAQAARHEAVARDALARLDASEARERRHLRDLGSARERLSELGATVTQLRARPATPPRSPRRRSPPVARPPASKPTKRRQKKVARAAKPVRKPSATASRVAAKKRRSARRKR